jgi:outer membrane lipoprotein SlyB
MVTQGRQSSFGLPLLVGLVAIVAAFAGSASILDRTTATSARPVVPTARTAVTADELPQRAHAPRAAVDGTQRVALADDGAVRRKVRCAGCGVVESVRRIDRREFAGGVCTVAGSDRLQIMGNADGGDEYGGVATLADTVDGVLTGRPGAVKMKVTSTFQIVVRFRDGSRRVFNEAAARTLRSGERIQVIAGLELPAV